MINDMDETKDETGLQPIIIHPEIQGDGRPFGEPELERRVQRRRSTDVDLSVIPAGRLEPDGESYSPPELSAGETKRAFSLDALRGLFLLSMTFGFTIMSEHLPAWMYHRQFDPQDHVIAVFGISWRDLAYASFLFTMAAAIPLTLTRRMENGELEIGIIFAALKRTFLLVVFALMVAHSNTFFLGYTDTGRLLGLLGFGLMWLVFTRRRKDWSATRYKLLNRIGWAATIAFLLLSPLAYGETFTFSRNDDIIIGLAFAALSGSILWYFTRKHIAWRLVALAVVVALYLSAHQDGWVESFWYNSNSFLFDPGMLTLLTVVVPGTIAGDLLLRWMRSGESRAIGLQSWSRGRTSLLSAISILITPLVVVGMYNRWVQATTFAVLGLVVAGFFLVRNPRGAAEELLQKLFLWGALWLVLGLFLEPSEGGIRKVPETLSYFFTVTGTTSLLLVAMTAIIDVLDKRRFVHLLIDLGHNPLLTYVVFTVFLNSVFELVHPLQSVLEGSPGESILRSIIMTILSVLIVRYFTRRRIFWRT